MAAKTGSSSGTERPDKGPGAVEMVDEAAVFLRHTPLSTFFVYYAGALPFCLALIYFTFDMMQSASAEQHLGPESLLLTVLYFWMKTCQAVFSRRLLASIEGGDPEPWTLWRWTNTAMLQAIYAASAVIAYPVALFITIPYGWVNAFYHSISIVATSEKATLRESFVEASKLAALWPRQNHLILGVLLVGLLFLFINLAAFFSMMPELLNIFFGISTVFDENSSAWNNSTLCLDLFVFCFLILNPLNKAIYVLRCFYGRARGDGTDLLTELRRQRTLRQALTAAAILIIGFLALTVSPAALADTPPPPPPQTDAGKQTDPAVLDRAIQKTLEKDDYSWRLPPPPEVKHEKSGVNKMLEKFFHALAKGIKTLLEPVWKFVRWLMGTPKEREVDPSTVKALSSFPWQPIFWCVFVLVIAFIIFLVVRNLRSNTLPARLAAREAVPVKTVDLESESIRADDLPEDSWLAMAQQLWEKGEARLALRAFYLATLSLLAQRQLIRLSPAKSNRDYIQEYTRRLRGDLSPLPPFRENIRLFEASWYGTHAVTATIIEAMRTNHQDLRDHVAV
jgi:hypothetical protein